MMSLLPPHKGNDGEEKKITAEVGGEEAFTVTWQVAVSHPGTSMEVLRWGSGGVAAEAGKGGEHR